MFPARVDTNSKLCVLLQALILLSVPILNSVQAKNKKGGIYGIQNSVFL